MNKRQKKHRILVLKEKYHCIFHRGIESDDRIAKYGNKEASSVLNRKRWK